MSLLGIDFGGTKAALRWEGAGGSAAEVRLLIEEGEPATSVIARTVAAAERLVADHGPVAAVGIVTPGVVGDRGIALAPNVEGWSELAFDTQLVGLLGVERVVVENDVKAAALAEARRGALRGADPGLYVNLGTGIAVATVIDGRVHSGAHGAAGEIGYGIVGGIPGADWSGSSAPLEQHSGGGGLAARARERFGAADVPALIALAADDPRAAEFLAGTLDELARHLATTVLALDPACVVFGGGMSRSRQAVVDPLIARLRTALPVQPDYQLSRFGPDASLQGALELARDAAGSPSPAHLQEA